jgi:hypothetical protein
LAGLRGAAGRVEIIWACAHLRGMVWQRSYGSDGWEFGGDRAALARLRSRPEDRRSHGLWSSSSVSLWGRAWCAVPAVLLVTHGVEKPSMS